MGKLAASILSADFGHLADQVKLVEPHADLIHVDVMDAHFVPPLTVGPIVVEAIRPVTRRTLHCHLMIEAPARLFDDFQQAGTEMVTCHVEALDDPADAVAQARKRDFRVGLAVNPETPVERLYPHLEEVDSVLVMTLHRTGWAGQPFNEDMLPKVEAVRREIDRLGLAVDVEVDGGINEETGRRCLAAGATVLAVASSIFKAPDPGEAARRLAAVVRGDPGDA
ncbi:MAG: ribulose-phosphate 3-epimerase [Actinobacteria bacterium]|nr:ribulose-phosphate 3-epimerase [Actinomycetota bacterium]